MPWPGSTSLVSTVRIFEICDHCLTLDSLPTVPEAYDRPDTYRNSDQPIEVGTTDLEGYSASKGGIQFKPMKHPRSLRCTENNGFFSKAISTQREDYQPDALPQVKVLAHVRSLRLFCEHRHQRG